MDYLCLKSSFLENPPYLYPYMGPCAMRDDFNLAEYFGRVTANSLVKVAYFKPFILLSLLLSIAASGITLLVCQKLFDTLAALIITILIVYGSSFYFLVDINYTLSQANIKVQLSADDVATCVNLLTKDNQVWLPSFLDETFKGNVPTPDKYINGPRVPQKLLFVKQSPEFTLFLIIFFKKLTLLANFIMFAYLFYYFYSSFWVKLFIMGFTLSYTAIILLYLIPMMLKQYIQCVHIQMMRDYDVIYQVIKEQKGELSRACKHFFEFAIYIRRFATNPTKETQIQHRPFLMSAFLKALQPFQKVGKVSQNNDRSAPEQEMIDMGITESDLGLHLPVSAMPDVCKKLGVLDVDRYEMLYMINFCVTQPRNNNDQDPVVENESLISPLRLLMYIQLRTQEVLQTKQKLLLESLEPFITIQIEPYNANDIQSRLQTEEVQQKQTENMSEQESSNQESDQKSVIQDLSVIQDQSVSEKQSEAEEKESEEQSVEEQPKQVEQPSAVEESSSLPEEEESEVQEKKINTSADQVQDIIDHQYQRDGLVDLNELDIFLESYCEVKLFDRGVKKILMKEFSYLEANTRLTLERLIEFIANQIDFIPS